MVERWRRARDGGGWWLSGRWGGGVGWWLREWGDGIGVEEEKENGRRKEKLE